MGFNPERCALALFAPGDCIVYPQIFNILMLCRIAQALFDKREKHASKRADRQEEDSKVFTKVGAVVDLKFVDKEVLAWQCGVRLAQRAQNVGSTTALLVLCENAVFQCDLLLDKVRMVSSDDLKRLPRHQSSFAGNRPGRDVDGGRTRWLAEGTLSGILEVSGA